MTCIVSTSMYVENSQELVFGVKILNIMKIKPWAHVAVVDLKDHPKMIGKHGKMLFDGTRAENLEGIEQRGPGLPKKHDNSKMRRTISFQVDMWAAMVKGKKPTYFQSRWSNPNTMGQGRRSSPRSRYHNISETHNKLIA